MLNRKTRKICKIISMFLVFFLFIAKANNAVAGTTLFNDSMNIIVDYNGDIATSSNVSRLGADLPAPNNTPFTGSDPGPFVYGIGQISSCNNLKVVMVGDQPAFHLCTSDGKNIPGLLYTIGLESSNGNKVFANVNLDSGKAVYLPEEDQTKAPNVTVNFMLLTKNGGGKSTPGVYLANTTIGLLKVKSLSTGTTFNATNTAQIKTNMTVTIIGTACAVSTSHDIAIRWPDLSASNIKNNTADKKLAEIKVDCDPGYESSYIDVTVSSSHGSADSNNGIVNTTAENLGLKLTWASNGEPIHLGETTTYNPLASGSSNQALSINAQPITTGSGVISGGDFSTDVTVTLEYR